MVGIDREEVKRDLDNRVKNEVSTRQRIQWRLGRRGAFLATMGVLYLALAYAYGVAEVPPFTYKQLDLQTSSFEILGVSESAALDIWAVLWALSGVTAIVTAWYPPGKDGYGFNALIGFALLWSVMSFIGQIALGAPRAAVTGVIFLVYSVTIFIASGMVDPGPRTKVVTNDHVES